GVQAEPVGNDIFHWQAVLHGVPETPWEGGIFRLELRFDEDYNERPPEVQFLTVPFHPNVDMHTGTPCIPLLQDPMEWDPDMSLCDLLSSLRTLLASPSLSHPANLAAAEIYTASPRLYGQLVRDCVVASRRVDCTCAHPAPQSDSKKHRH
ncbi:ubiquitin-conjugating enzyme/RWD-like protein, partial [Fimicolochytrium jonesii]|uniref:ubiquitin-conjugating enzyme/RWD-like protein n=1 Tax=Fimicolochytrium jonesii TaxID=1396493 RepID=UPI0022FDC866